MITDEFNQTKYGFESVLKGLHYLGVGRPLDLKSTYGHQLGDLFEFESQEALDDYLACQAHIDMVKKYAGLVYVCHLVPSLLRYSNDLSSAAYCHLYYGSISGATMLTACGRIHKF